MADKMTPEQRRRCMQSIKGKDTKPEVLVRKFLWAQGFRYRLYVNSLPGRPDIVMRKYKTAIFINGCFWHGHRVGDNGYNVASSLCCKIPSTRRDFWVAKITRNKERDIVNYERLIRNGWKVLVVWECQLRKKEERERTLQALSARLSRQVLDSYSKGYMIPEEALSIAAEDRNDGYNTKD